MGGLRLLWSDEAVWGHQDVPAAYVHGLMISRSNRGQGLGEELLAWAEEQARAAGASALRLDCVEANEVLRSFYRRVGLTEVGRRDFDGPRHSAVLFEKPLYGLPADELRFWTRPAQPDLPPVVLLHGSGQDETALLGFAENACPAHTLVPVRGRVPWEGGFAFFRRRPDRTLDQADLALGAKSLRRLLRRLRDDGHQPPVLVGYSNGAIAAAAAILTEPRLSVGAVLLRPLSPMPGQALPSLDGYSLLLVAARDDARRRPDDAPALHRQLLAAGASSTLAVLPTGHPLTTRDQATVASWLRDLVRTGNAA